MPKSLLEQVVECIAETIQEIERDCKITLYDIYGSTDGFHEADFATESEENSEYEELAGVSDYLRRGD